MSDKIPKLSLLASRALLSQFKYNPTIGVYNEIKLPVARTEYELKLMALVDNKKPIQKYIFIDNYTT